MTLRSMFIHRQNIIFMLLYFIRCVDAAEKGTFTYKYIDNTSNNILQLRCTADCSGDNSLGSIVIYNSTSMKQMVVWRVGKPATSFKQSSVDITYYVRALSGEESVCFLDLLIVNIQIFTRLELGCNTSITAINGDISSASIPLFVDKGGLVSQDGQHNISTTTFIILIAIIAVLFLLTIFFMSLCIRGWCRHRNSALYQTHLYSPYRNISSELSFTKSPSSLSVRRESEFKFPPTNGPARKSASRSDINISAHRLGQPPLPPAPPLKFNRKERPYTLSSSSSNNTIKVTYERPIDAIEPEFSEDGDVTYNSGENRHGYPGTYGHRTNKQSTDFYSCIPVNSVDI